MSSSRPATPIVRRSDEAIPIRRASCIARSNTRAERTASRTAALGDVTEGGGDPLNVLYRRSTIASDRTGQ